MNIRIFTYPFVFLFWALILFIVSLFSSCATGRMDKEARANIHLPVQPVEESKEKVRDKKLSSVIDMKDRHGNITTYVQTETDTAGNRQLSVQLGQVTVTAKLKSIPERFGKVGIDFVITVPEALTGKGLQLNLTPFLIKKKEHIPFDDLVITGDEFDKMRMDGYKAYEKYLSKIIPDSLFNGRFVNMRAFNKHIKAYEKSEYRRVYKDSMDHVHYAGYINRLNSRYKIFNAKMVRGRQWLAKRLGFEDIKQRYAVFGRDTVYVSRFYSKHYNEIVNLLPRFHLLREVNENTIIKKYRKEKYRDGFVNDYRPVTAADSAILRTKYYRTKLIERNNKRIAGKEEMFEKLVKFPKNPYARLDTIIFGKGNFEYHYHQELSVDEDCKRMQVYLNGEVNTLRGINYQLPVSDTLTYSVSSMIQFMDTTPRYMRKIIERKASSSLRANITFKTGKYDMDIDLGDNRSELNKVQDMLDRLTETGEFVMDSISLIAGCSPEGSFRSNMLLSKRRAESISRYLSGELSEIEGIAGMLKPYPKGEDWQGLSRLVIDSLESVNKQFILELIAAETDPDKKETDIRSKYPADYKYIREKLYPHLRAVDFTFHVHRRGMARDTIHTTEPDTVYAQAIRLMEKRKYSGALQILTEYQDWNTAICLMSLGYDQAAYHILLNEKQSSDSQYLLAILASRMGREQEAVDRYLRACRLDPAKRWRGALDPEINKLIKAYSLNREDEDTGL